MMVAMKEAGSVERLVDMMEDKLVGWTEQSTVVELAMWSGKKTVVYWENLSVDQLEIK